MTYTGMLNATQVEIVGFDVQADMVEESLSVMLKGGFSWAYQATLKIDGLDGEWMVRSVAVQSGVNGMMTDLSCKKKAATSFNVPADVANLAAAALGFGPTVAAARQAARHPNDVEGVRAIAAQAVVQGGGKATKTTLRGTSNKYVILDELEADYVKAPDPAPCDFRWRTTRSDGTVFSHSCVKSGTDHEGSHRAVDGVKVDREVELPPHATYAELDMRPAVGDEIVVTAGDQKGWRGVVTSATDGTIDAVMTKPDGSKGNNGMPVKHARFVAKVLPQVPAFDSQADAEAWLAAQDRDIRRAYFDGQTVRFERSVRINRVVKDGPRRGKRKRQFAEVVEDIAMTGKVVGWAKNARTHMGVGGVGPGYQIVTLDMPGNEGEPTLLWVEPHRILHD